MEEKIKKRGWVKDAAIIFLAVMLVLTFFSNTIMNRSLPEVASASITSGPITTQIRGTGTVTARENYEVMINQTRLVQSVLVEVGQEVKSGDVLFVLAEGDSAELTAAEDELRQLNMSYQRALLNATTTDYSRENRDIEQARTKLAEAQAERDALVVTDEELTSAKNAVTAAQNEVNKCEIELTKAQEKLDSLGGLSEPDDYTLNSLYQQMESAQKAIDDAKLELETAMVMYGDLYNALIEEAEAWITDTEAYKALETDEQRISYITEKLPVYLPAVAEQYKNAADDSSDYYLAYTTITACHDKISSCQDTYDDLSMQYSSIAGGDNSYLYSRYSKERDEAQKLLDEANLILNNKKDVLTKLQEEDGAYEAKVEECESLQATLEDMIFALEEQQKADGVTQQLEALDLQELSVQIARQQELVEELKGGSGAGDIRANVSGIVRSITVSAGHTAQADTVLATIEVPDLGYTMSFTVTNEQARKVRVGDTATVSNYYWGSRIEAELTSISPDPANPQSNRILNFSLSGDVTDGASLTLSVGQRSSDYDYIVPNSAIRSDSNGTFVYVITVKSSPLSNRYIATRVDVEVLASDDQNSAISGSFEWGDFVITTSTKPITNGDQVNMSDAG